MVTDSIKTTNPVPESYVRRGAHALEHLYKNSPGGVVMRSNGAMNQGVLMDKFFEVARADSPLPED